MARTIKSEKSVADKNGSAVVEAPVPAGPKVKPAPDGMIVLPQLNIMFMNIRLIGDSPLICHRWSAKARMEMLSKQMGKAKQAKAPKDPEEDFRESLYPHPEGGYGFPTIAFKAAAVDACSHISGVTKVEARGSFHIVGELARLVGEPRPREDMVRIAMGTADIRFRGEFPSWATEFVIRYNANMLTPEQIANLFNTAGFAIGVGEWRPQKDGSFGMFHVD